MSETESETSEQGRGRRFLREARKSWGWWLALVVIFPFRSAVADWNDVPTGSMQPTILIGDRIVVNKLAYDLKLPFTTTHLLEWGDPERGEVVVCFSPADGRRLVKRVVGVPGDTLEVRRGVVFLNGERLRYRTLDAEWTRGLDREARREGYTAEEVLGEHPHPVRYLPGRGRFSDYGPVEVPEGHYFLMGDNRDNSFDSRGFGPVPRASIVGRAVGSIDLWPFRSF